MRFVCAADCGVDRYLGVGLDRAGGIGLNVAVHARRLCAADDVVTVVAPVGTDAGAELVRAACAATGIEACLPVVAGATPVQEIRLAGDGERRFGRYLEGVLGGYRVGAPEREAIARADVLATVAFGQALAFFESVLEAPTRALRAVDFTNLNDVGDPLAFVERHAPRLDIGLFGLTREDAGLIGGLEAIAQRTGRLFVVTLGPAGALALGGSERRAQPAIAVERVVDTTGAGDAFTAAFLCSYAHDREVGLALRRGAEVAAGTLGSVGSFTLPVGNASC